MKLLCRSLTGPTGLTSPTGRTRRTVGTIAATVCLLFIAPVVPPAIALENPAPPAADTLADTVDTAAPAVEPELYPIQDLPVGDTVTIPVLDFKNTDIRDVLRALGIQYGVNIYLEPEVTGTISLYLVDIPVRSAIDFIVKRSSYAYTVENGIVKVYKYEPPEPPPPPPPPPPPVVFEMRDSLLTFDFQEVPLDEVVRMFTDSIGTNIVVEGPVQKNITGHLTDLPPEKAMKVLFESNGLELAGSDGVWFVSRPQWGGDTKPGTAPGRRRLSITVGDSDRVSIEVNDAALDNVIRTIALQSGINIIIYEKINGTLSAKFDSLHIDDALRFLLQNTTYTFWKDKRVYFIGSREMSQQKTSAVIPLRHIMAEEKTLSTILPPHLTNESVIRYDKEHNALIVIGSFDIVAQARDFVERIDQPIPQVLIEALVVDFKVGRIQEFGLDLFAPDSIVSMSENYFPGVKVGVGRGRIERNLRKVLKYLNIKEIIELPRNFMGIISVLENDDIAKVLSTPQIATLNGNTASITIGETQYYKLRTESNYVRDASDPYRETINEEFREIKFNNTLMITPWVMADRYIIVDIEPEFNIPRQKVQADIPPSVDQRKLKSTVRLKDGQTIVLGGQRNTVEKEERKGIPWIMNIPVLGWLFSKKVIVKEETQMMIFLTPYVYYRDEGAVNPREYFGRRMKNWAQEHERRMERIESGREEYRIEEGE